MRFEIQFSGHKNIRSNHQKTIEITTDSALTPRGDCIIGVNAATGCASLPEELKEKIRDPDSKITFLIQVGEHHYTVRGNGHPDLSLTDPEDIVIRKSGFICPRTMAINCDAASDMLPREMVSLLQDPLTRGTFTIQVD